MNKKPVNLTSYESIQWDLARYRGLQRVLKTRRKQIGTEIAFCNTRFRDNGGHYDGRDLVPERAAKDMIRAVTKQGEIERAIIKNRLRIRSLETKLLTLKLSRAMQRAFEEIRDYMTPPAPREMVKHILRMQGYFLHDNNEISGPGGKLIAHYGDDAKYYPFQNLLKYTIKPVQALEFITLDLTLEDL